MAGVTDRQSVEAPPTVAARRPESRARLVAVTGGNLGRVFNVGPRGVTIGRDSLCDVPLDQPDISRRHARIQSSARGWLIEDLDSANGTFVNGVEVGQEILGFGDRIQVGEDTMFLFAHCDDLGDSVLELQKMEAVGQLAGGVAHDFNNLLMVISSAVDFVDDQLREQGIGTGELLESLTDARVATRRATDLTGQLLRFSRREEREKSCFDMAELVAEVVQLCRRTFDPGISLEVEVEPGLEVVGDRSQLHQVLLNLCINARDAMPGGGVLQLRGELEQMPPGSATNPLNVLSGCCAALTVSDTGIGMDEQTRARIFEPFYTTKKDRGTGLGLATALSIVKQHGGDLAVTSEPGQGSTFKVMLPSETFAAGGDKTTSLPPIREPQEHRERPRRVLLVDDEQAVLQSAGRLLQSLDYEVVSARNGKEAVAVYEKQRRRIGVVLLDVTMPMLGGRDTFNILRAIDPEAQIVLMSGRADSHSVSDLLEAGAVCFLSKPHTEQDLRRALARAGVA